MKRHALPSAVCLRREFSLFFVAGFAFAALLALTQSAAAQPWYAVWAPSPNANSTAVDQNTAGTGIHSFLAAQPTGPAGAQQPINVQDSDFGGIANYIGNNAPGTKCLWVFSQCYGGGFFDELNQVPTLLQSGLSASYHNEFAYYPLVKGGVNTDWVLQYLISLGKPNGFTTTATDAAANDPYGPNPKANRNTEKQGSEHPVLFTKVPIIVLGPGGGMPGPGMPGKPAPGMPGPVMPGPGMMNPANQAAMNQAIVNNLQIQKNWFAIIYAGQPSVGLDGKGNVDLTAGDAQSAVNCLQILTNPKTYALPYTSIYILYGNGQLAPNHPILNFLGKNVIPNHILLANLTQLQNTVATLYGKLGNPPNPPGIFIFCIDHGGNTSPAGQNGVVPAPPGPPTDPGGNGPPDPDAVGSGEGLPGIPPTPEGGEGSKSSPFSISDGSIDFNANLAVDSDPGPADTNSPDLWFSYTALYSGSVTAALYNIDYDAYIAAYDGADLDTNADLAYGNDSYPAVTFNAQAGHTYLFQVGSLDGSQGVGTLAFSSVQFASINSTPAGTLLTWNASTNDLIDVQWSPTLNPPMWTTFTGDVTSTTGVFTFLDDGSQTGGLGAQRYYQLLVYP